VSSGFKDHFSTTAANYASYRPSYPIRLVDELARVSPGTDLALDVGCGTGQLSVLLAERFEKVIATDASAAQIEKATPHKNVTYKTALAENSGLENSSVDLITVAQAAHWLDLEKFYTEVSRIAKPNAVIALITYGVLHVEGEAVDAVVQDFYYKIIGPYWPPERRHVEEGYRNLPFPFRETTLPSLAIEVSWRLQDLIGYCKTWSAVTAAQKALGNHPVDQFEQTLRKEWSDPDRRRRVTWPLSVRVGHIGS
jgi:SAM-dependent methyltransferase